MTTVWSQSQSVAVKPQSDDTVSFVAADVLYDSFISRSRSGYKKISRKVSEKFCHCDSMLFIFLPCVLLLPFGAIFPFQINLLTGYRTGWFSSWEPVVPRWGLFGAQWQSNQLLAANAESVRCGDGVKLSSVWQTTVKLQSGASMMERLVFTTTGWRNQKNWRRFALFSSKTKRWVRKAELKWSVVKINGGSRL